MATIQAPTGSSSKPSFAKVAASTRKEPTPAVPLHPNTKAPKAQDGGPAPVNTGAPAIANGAVSQRKPVQPMASTLANARDDGQSEQAVIDKVTGSLADVNLNVAPPSLVVNGSMAHAVAKNKINSRGDSGSDDSIKADSGSELGAKPPSIDGKSITSGTTFALDEKESLRPDDSASVKAAAEDDDGFSVRGSVFAGSRMGSELAARQRGIVLGDIPERRLAQAPSGGIMTPQSDPLDQKAGINSAMTPDGPNIPSDALNVIYRQAPDEKLLEAMQSPRDRLFLLRLEKDVIEFVQDSKEPYMDLPPTNSFCRMLIHKLADYYHMTHSFEHHISSVRIFRTPFCRVPPSLALMMHEPNPSTSSTPPPAILPRKIMRRGQDGEAGTPSAGPSKPTSEDGSDSKEKTANSNQKLTREEREELYKLARERIFGSTEESTPDTEAENGMSRTSSASAQNRSNLGKRGKSGKQRRDDSDSFDSRNQYTAYWGPQQPTWVAQQQQYMPPQGPPMMPPNATGYHPQQIQGYGPPQPNAAYQGGNMQMAQNPFPQYGMPQPYPPAQQAPRGYQPAGGSPMAAYGSPAPPSAPQQWQQGYPTGPYPPRGPTSVSSGSMGPAAMGHSPSPMGQSPSHMGQPQMGPGQPGSVPYAYGQLPAHANPHDPKSQHPIPGSYNRNHAFNPQTQSFIPGGNGMPMVQAPQPPFTAPGSHHGSPQIGSPHLAYPGYQPQQQQVYGGGYGMVRQQSNTSVPGYHPPPQMMPAPGQHGGMPPQMALQHPQAPNMSQGQPIGTPPRQQPGHHGYNHLPAYGNPASLPQKPATGM